MSSRNWVWARRKPLDTPVCTTAREMTEDEKVPLEEAVASHIRPLAVKLNYLSLDRPDIRFGHRQCAPSPRNRGLET